MPRKPSKPENAEARPKSVKKQPKDTKAPAEKSPKEKPKRVISESHLEKLREGRRLYLEKKKAAKETTKEACVCEN